MNLTLHEHAVTSCPSPVAHLLWEPTMRTPVFTILQQAQGIRPLTPSTIFCPYTELAYANVHSSLSEYYDVVMVTPTL